MSIKDHKTSSVKPVFYDDTGHRRIIVNFTLVFLLVIFSVVLVFVGYYIHKLKNINSLGANTSSVSPPASTTALLYTDSNTNALSVLNENIETLNSVFIPRYSVDKSGFHSPKEYLGWWDDINFYRRDRQISYKSYFILSNKDYVLPPTERNITPALSDPVYQPNKIITDENINKIIADITESKASGLMLDFDAMIFRRASDMDNYKKWVDNLSAKLKKSDIKLGFIVRSDELNSSYYSYMSKSDILYIRLDNARSYNTQINDLTVLKKYNGTSVYEIPTVSSQQDLSVEEGYTESKTYKSVQSLLMNKNFEIDKDNPITITEPKKARYTIVDAVTAYNFLRAINDKGLDRNSYLLSISDPGFEEYTIWKMLEQPFDFSVNFLTVSREMYASLDVEADGKGRIYKFKQDHRPGVRDIFPNEDNYIVKSDLKQLDTPAKITLTGEVPKKIAITFDDGPHPTNTLKVLDILDKYNVKGTFFLVGENVANNPSIAKEIVKRGHEVENHSYTHPKFTQIDDNAKIDQLKTTSLLISEITGQPIKYVRIPYTVTPDLKSLTGVNYLKLIDSQGLKDSEYDIDSKDWELKTADEVVEKVKKEMQDSKGNYSQILMHDSHQNIQTTLESLPRIIEYLQAQNIEIVRLDQLDDVHNNDLNDNVFSMLNALDARNVLGGSFIWFIMISFAFVTVKYAWLLLGPLVTIVLKLPSLIARIIKKIFKKSTPSKRKYMPNLSVVIACYNEELVIGKTLQSLINCNYPKLQIIVIDDGSKDDTTKIVQEFARKYPNIRLVRKKNGGKAAALMEGIKNTKNKWLVFCDADTQFYPDALHNFVKNIKVNNKVAAIAGEIIVGNDKNFLTRSQVIEYGIAHLFMKPAQHLINSITVVPGAVGLWDRNTLKRADYFTPDTLAEDADTTITVISLGKKVVYDPAVKAKTEAPENIKMLFKQRTRWQLGNMQTLVKHWRGLLNPKYRALGFIGLPFFYIELASAVFYPFIVLYSLIMPLVYLFGWREVVPNIHVPISPRVLVVYGFVLIGIEIWITMITIVIKNPPRKWPKLFITIPYYVIFYKLFLCFATLVSFGRALRGTLQGWGHLKRTASVAVVK